MICLVRLVCNAAGWPFCDPRRAITPGIAVRSSDGSARLGALMAIHDIPSAASSRRLRDWSSTAMASESAQLGYMAFARCSRLWSRMRRSGDRRSGTAQLCYLLTVCKSGLALSCLHRLDECPPRSRCCRPVFNACVRGVSSAICTNPGTRLEFVPELFLPIPVWKLWLVWSS